MNKPQTYCADLTDLPEALHPFTAERRWTCWKWGFDKTGKWTKPPYHPCGQHSKSNDLTTWSSFSEALDAVLTGKFDGIGLMLAGTPIGAIDADKCRNADTGAIDQWSTDIVNDAHEEGAYVEVTVSGTGVRIIGKSAGVEIHRSWTVNGGSKIELYRNTPRYITVSGLQLGQCGELQDLPLFDRLIAKYDVGDKKSAFDFNDAPEQFGDVDDIILNGAPVGQRSEAFHYVVNQLATQGLSADEIESRLRKHPNGISPKYLADQRLRQEIDRSLGKRRETQQPQPTFPHVDDGDKSSSLSSGLVKGVLPYEGIAFIGGQSGAGKSFIMIELATCLALLLPFFGKKVREQVGSAIIAAEGAGGIQNRLNATKLKYSIDQKLPIRWFPFYGDLCSAADLQTIVPALKKTNEEFLSTHGVRLGAIFIDTTGAAFVIDDENDAAKINRVIKLLKWMGKETSALILPLHHYGKTASTGLRGSSAYRAGGDVVLSVLCSRDEITGESGDRSLCVAKARDDFEGTLAPFDLPLVQLGADEDGDPIFNRYVEIGEFGRNNKMRESMTEKIALRALNEAIGDYGEIITSRGIPPNTQCVKEDCWREYAYHRGISDGQDESSRRKAFKRAKESLITRGKIGIWDPWVWVIFKL